MMYPPALLLCLIKNCRCSARQSLEMLEMLCRYGVYRAGRYASAAVNTIVADIVLGIARRDGVNRTIVDANAARYTFAADFMSHGITSKY